MSASFNEDQSSARSSENAVKASGSVNLEERREHRRRPRADYVVGGLLEVAGATKRGSGLAVRTRDVSEIGVAVRCPESIAIGSQVKLSLVSPSGTPLNLRGSVVRLEAMGDGLYELGVRFVQEQPLLSALRVDMAIGGR